MVPRSPGLVSCAQGQRCVQPGLLSTIRPLPRQIWYLSPNSAPCSKGTLWDPCRCGPCGPMYVAQSLTLASVRRKAALSLLMLTWTGGADSCLLPVIARTAPLALSLNFSSLGCWEPVVGFEPTTCCLGASGSAWVNCLPLCAGVHTRRCLLVFVSSVVPEWSPVIHGGSPLLAVKIEKRPLFT